MLKPYHFIFLGAILIMALLMITGFGFKTKKVYKNMWKNEYKSEYVVFTSTRDGNYEIYSMNSDGSEVLRLTDNPTDDYDPSISPDGQKIAFTSYRDADEDGNYEIYIMNFDGSNQTRITYSADRDADPAWSPDGKQIAFTSWRDGVFGEIYVMNADGTDQRNITNNPANDYRPVWSPDGSQIAFESTRDDTTAPNPIDRIGKIYLMNADGTNPRCLIDAESRWPSWSPDGTKIAFMHFQESTLPPELHILDLSSQTETALDIGMEFDGRVAWSPDGQELLFTSYALEGYIAIEREHGQLYRISAAGSTPIQITFGASNGFADWKGTIADPSAPTVGIENTATAEAVSTLPIVVTVLSTDTPEVTSTETLSPLITSTDTPELAPTETLVN